MRTIDIHAHLMPQCFWKTVDAGGSVVRRALRSRDPIGYTVQQGKRDRVSTPKLRWTPEQRLKDMDAQGVDVQVISIHVPLFNYHLDVDTGRRLAEAGQRRDCRDDAPIPESLCRTCDFTGSERQSRRRGIGAGDEIARY